LKRGPEICITTYHGEELPGRHESLVDQHPTGGAGVEDGCTTVGQQHVDDALTTLTTGDAADNDTTEPLTRSSSTRGYTHDQRRLLNQAL